MDKKERQNILIVDDRHENIMALEKVLKRPDLNIMKATSGNDALAMVLEYDFALVLLDVQMPDMDGFETAELMRENRETGQIPIIFVTAISKEEKHIFKGYESGAVDYLFKPIDTEILNSKVSIFLELGNQKRLIEKQAKVMQEQAQFDLLTGLPNRTLFTDRFNQTLSEAKRNNGKFALLFLDLDRFKNVNDALGHDAGDLLLKEAATRLKSCVRRSSDTVARLGGDEFTTILTCNITSNSAAIVAQKIIDAIAQPFNLNGIECTVGVSIGISLYPSDSDNVESLMKDADIAMYQAKNSGRNNYQFYSPSMNIKALDRLRLEGDLRKAIQRDELILYYQPQLDINTKKIIGSEALIRWNRINTGLVSPDDFIPIAEETGIITQIGEWVIRNACKQHNVWQKTGISSLSMSINISAKQFRQENFVELIAKLLDETGMSPDCLELEYTESCIMENADIAITMMNKLKEMHVRLSIDNFGTGSFSLKMIKHLPIDKIKIDKSFVQDVTNNTKDTAIVKAIIAMAHSLKLKVIAEGVETNEQFELLKSLNCNEVQGFLFSKPVPADEFKELLSRIN